MKCSCWSVTALYRHFWLLKRPWRISWKRLRGIGTKERGCRQNICVSFLMICHYSLFPQSNEPGSHACVFRLKHAVSELLYTGSNITRIAMNSGFSNVSAFNRVFRDYYGIAPTEYRNQNKERMERKFWSKEKLKNKLRQELQALEKA